MTIEQFLYRAKFEQCSWGISDPLSTKKTVNEFWLADSAKLEKSRASLMTICSADTPYHYLWPECIMCWQWTPLLHFSDFMTNPANLYQCGVKASLNPSLVNRRQHGCHRTWVTVRTMDGAMLTISVVINWCISFLPKDESSVKKKQTNKHHDTKQQQLKQ